ncbi:MAG: tryptophan 7-halogenase [Planctomycetes bacterium]|nr:tryptophan 7-halogenase [Planctomycetota bacterium]
MDYDVAIIGGGPGGSTVGAMLRKYNPGLKVAIIEREAFPREHIGESQLPAIGAILDEMGAWDKVEAANFIIKLGATYTWGKTKDPWVFNFIPPAEVRNDPRPGKFEGWRQRVAFQVDRAIYDQVLLKHAAELGCETLQPIAVTGVEHEGDAISGLRLSDGRRVTARYYIDASGNAAVLRRAMGVKIEAPTLLQNVAFWDYWSRPGMNAKLLDSATVRIQIRSLPYGWIWYIALDENRTSVGLVCPSDYFKNCGLTPEQLYADSMAAEPTIANMLSGSSRDGQVRRTTDWSYVSDRGHGQNWFLVGEALGFADPILSAGMTLTQSCARHCAYVILELERGQHDRSWLLDHYDQIQLARVRQHIKFADYWYSGNGQFLAVRENCAAIAAQAGLKLTPDAAFRWLSHGGIDDDFGNSATGGYSVSGIRGIQWRLSHETEGIVRNQVDGKTHFKLRLDGADQVLLPRLLNGRIHPITAYVRSGETLPLAGGYKLAVEALQKSPLASELMKHLQGAAKGLAPQDQKHLVETAIQCLELMVTNGWVKTSQERGKPALSVSSPLEGQIIYSAR